MNIQEKELMGRLANSLKCMLERNTNQADWSEYQNGKQAVRDFIEMMSGTGCPNRHAGSAFCPECPVEKR